jgi:uncharacterized protein
MRAAAAAIGVVFGFTLAWSGLADPDVIRRGLLFEDLYLFFLFGAALATASLGVHALRRLRVRALVTGEPVSWVRTPLERRHIVGSVLFGTGWAVSAACPGPVVAQLGAGVLWSVATFAGIVVGIRLYLARQPAGDAGGGVAAAPTQ